MTVAQTSVDERVVVDLASTDATMGELVGGKAGNLGEAMTAGFTVPAGFCVTTNAYRDVVAGAGAAGLAEALAALDGVAVDDVARQAELAAAARDAVAAAELPAHVRQQVVAGHERLAASVGGEVAVAVRSSATAEDLPFASFAGQQDTYLGVTGADDVVAAVRRCWASLWTDRAVGYRAANGIDHRDVRIAVVVQVMVDAVVSGVLFTANPVTGKRTEMVVDAAPGLGEGVVSGTVDTDHYVLGADVHESADGCLSAAQLATLGELGHALEAHFGSPQDAEWSFDGEGTLWLLQSRPITTLFPIPATTRTGTRAYLSVSAVQGVQQPLTPMGLSMMAMAAAGMWELAGVDVDPERGPEGFVHAGGRMFSDLTAILRSKSLRKDLPARLAIQGPRVVRAVERILADPRFAPEPGLPFRFGPMAKVTVRFAGPSLVAIVRSLTRPAAARARAYQLAEELERRTTAPAGELTAAQRLDFLATAPREIMGRPMIDMVMLLFGGLGASGAPASLLGRYVEPGEAEAVLRGMPHNPTTEMDLELWRLASNVGDARQLLASTPPPRLAEMYHAGELPDIGLDGFLAKYGRRAVAEIDVGVPRWAEDPTPVFAVIANYLRLTEGDETPDARFARSTAEAERKIDELVARARRRRPVRARFAGYLMRQAREIAGLRELPKFASLHGFWQVRQQLLLLGADLVANGLLDRADDVMFLDFPEVRSAVAGADLRGAVAERRLEYEREMRRRHLPVVLLSDGTEPEAEVPAEAAGEGVLSGMPAAPGVVTGAARVVLDPANAHVEPGEILVAPSTDPGWTPLFLTAGGLVTEMGAPNSHGPTVAREYGIPAVIGIRGATQQLHTGQRITVDGAAGTVTVDPDEESWTVS